jgi:hypothetical protein
VADVSDDQTDNDLIDQLRKAASIWFKNADLLLLEELIRRFHRLRVDKARLRE